MKKDLFKKPLMISLALCLATSVNVFGSTAEITSSVAAGTTVSGSSTVTATPVHIVVPIQAAVTFVIDPLEKKVAGQQIFSEQLPIINKGSTPVKINVAASIVPTAGGSIVDSFLIKSREGIKKDDLNETAPEAYIGLVPTATITADNSNKITATTDSKTIEVALDKPDASDTKKDANLEFTLAKATFEADGTTLKALAANGKGVGSFKFVGAVNNNATWIADEIKPKVTYSITPINDTVMSTVKFVPEANTLTSYKNADTVTVVSRPTLKPSSIGTNTVDLKTRTDATYTLNFGEGASAGDTISEVRIGGLVIGSPAGYKYDTGTKILTLNKDAGFYTTTITNPGEYFLIVTFANGKKAIEKLNVIRTTI